MPAAPQILAIALTIPDGLAGRLFGGGDTAARLLERLRSLPPTGRSPDTQSPEMLQQVLLARALCDGAVSGAEAVELAAPARQARSVARSSGGA